MNFKFHRTTSYTWNFQNFTRCYHNSCDICLTFIFSDSHKKFSLVLLQMICYILSPWKMLKKNAIFFNLFWYKVFVHWKLKLLSFLVDSVSFCYLNLDAWNTDIGPKKKKNWLHVPWITKGASYACRVFFFLK